MKELFLINNLKYSLKYDMKTISRIELLTNCSIMNVLACGGLCDKVQLQIMLALGMVNCEGNHIKEKDALKLAGELLQANDNGQLARITLGVMIKACPFLVKDRGVLDG